MAKYECKICGYVFDEQQAGETFDNLYSCPICDADKSAFNLIEEDEDSKAETEDDDDDFVFEEADDENGTAKEESSEEAKADDNKEDEEKAESSEENKEENGSTSFADFLKEKESSHLTTSEFGSYGRKDFIDEVLEENSLGDKKEETESLSFEEEKDNSSSDSGFTIEKRQEFWKKEDDISEKENEEDKKSSFSFSHMGSVERVIGGEPFEVKDQEEKEEVENEESSYDNGLIQTYYSGTKPVKTEEELKAEEEARSKENPDFVPLWGDGMGAVQKVVGAENTRSSSVKDLADFDIADDAEELVFEEVKEEKEDTEEVEEPVKEENDEFKSFFEDNKEGFEEAKEETEAEVSEDNKEESEEIETKMDEEGAVFLNFGDEEQTEDDFKTEPASFEELEESVKEEATEEASENTDDFYTVAQDFASEEKPEEETSDNEEKTEDTFFEAADESTEEVTEPADSEETNETSEAAEETTEDTFFETADENAEEEPAETSEDTFFEAADENTEEESAETAEDTFFVAAEDNTEEKTEEAAEETAEETTDVNAEEAAETEEDTFFEAADENTEEAAEASESEEIEASDETVETTEEAPEETAETEENTEAAEETVIETEEPAETTEDTFFEAAEENNEETAEEANEEVPESTEEATETSEMTEEAAAESEESEETTEEAPEETIEESFFEAADENVEETTETSEEATETPANEEVAEEAAEEEILEDVSGEDIDGNLELQRGYICLDENDSNADGKPVAYSMLKRDTKYTVLYDTEAQKIFDNYRLVDSNISNGLENIILLPAQCNPLPLKRNSYVETKTVIGALTSCPVEVRQPFCFSKLFIWGEHIPNNSKPEKYTNQALVLVKGEEGHIPNLSSKEELREEVEIAKARYNGTPVGIDLVAGRIEADLEACVYAKVDFVILNDVSSRILPYALRRARNYLNRVNSKLEILVCVEALKDAQELAKILALGANFVLVERGFDIEMANNMTEALKEICRSTGHNNVHDLNLNDICTIDTDLAMYTDICHV